MKLAHKLGAHRCPCRRWRRSAPGRHSSRGSATWWCITNALSRTSRRRRWPRPTAFRLPSRKGLLNIAVQREAGSAPGTGDRRPGRSARQQLDGPAHPPSACARSVTVRTIHYLGEFAVAGTTPCASRWTSRRKVRPRRWLRSARTTSLTEADASPRPGERLRRGAPGPAGATRAGEFCRRLRPTLAPWRTPGGPARCVDRRPPRASPAAPGARHASPLCPDPRCRGQPCRARVAPACGGGRCPDWDEFDHAALFQAHVGAPPRRRASRPAASGPRRDVRAWTDRRHPDAWRTGQLDGAMPERRGEFAACARRAFGTLAGGPGRASSSAPAA